MLGLKHVGAELGGGATSTQRSLTPLIQIALGLELGVASTGVFELKAGGTYSRCSVNWYPCQITVLVLRFFCRFLKFQLMENLLHKELSFPF